VPVATALLGQLVDVAATLAFNSIEFFNATALEMAAKP
jgi:hypothetical protein